MKQKLLKMMLLLCALIVGSSSVWGQVTIWSEDFSGYSADDVPSGTISLPHKGTSLDASGTLTYACTNGTKTSGSTNGGTTRVYNENSAGGTKPEMLVGRKGSGTGAVGGSFTATVPIDNIDGTITLKYKQNNKSLQVTMTAGSLSANATNSTAAEQTLTLSNVTSSHTSVTITFQATSGDNVRLDNIVLTGYKADASKVATPSIRGNQNFLESTTVTISCETDGSSIQYSTDNGESWTDYSTPFNITSTTTVKAKATKDGMTDSDVSDGVTFTKVTPITVSAALTAIDALADNGTIAGQCVSGIVCTAGSLSSGAITYYISADGTETNRLQVYKGKGLNNAAFEAAGDIAVGDEVVIYGTLKKFKSGSTITPEFDAGSYLLSKVTSPTLSVDPATAQAFTYVAGNGPSDDQMFTITGANLVSADITATVSSDYEITDNTDYSSSVTIANGDIVSVRLKAGLAKGAHNGTLTLSSTGATNVVINLSGTVTGQTYAIAQKTAPATAHGTINFSPASPIEEGTEVTLSAEPAAGYDFTADSWVIYKQSGEDYVVDNSITVTANKFNMPAYAIWVDGTFTAKPTYAITCVADPVAGGTILSDENAYEGKTVTITCEATSGYELTGIVITKTSDGSTTSITPTKSGDDYTFTMPGYAVTATATFAPCFIWDLSTNSYSSATTSLVTWSSTYATMTNAKGKSSNDANSYLGGSGTYTQTRFYQNQIITFTPATGYEITKVEITATSSTYAGYFNTTWTNASASVNGSVVTVTPTDRNKSFYMTVSSATRATEIKVYYQASTIPYITASNVNIACDATNGAVTYTVNNPKDGGNLTAELTTGDWLELGAVSTTIPFTTTANNTKLDRTATVTLTYTYDTSKTATKVVTITQAGNPSAKDAPTITVPDDVEIAYGSTYTVDDSGITGGTITITSGNTSVATVSGLVITSVAAGTVEITVSTEEDATYAAGSETFLLTVTAPEGKKSPALFYESFDKNTANQGGNDGKWDQGSGGTITLDNTSGISLSSSAYAASKCVRLGTSSNQGSATITISASVDDVFTLSFKAAPWNEEASTKATVSVTGGTITGISTDAMTAKQWNEYEGTITATAENVEIVIASTGSKRFFLDEVKIEKVGVENTANVTLNKYGYATYCSVNPMDFTTTEGYTAWRVSNVSGDGTITFEKITEAIKGGQGVLLYNKDADGVNTSNVTINFADGTTEFTTEQNKLVGTTAPTYVATDTYFGLKADAFVPVNAGTVPAGKALLPYIDESGIKSFTFVFNDSETGITETRTVSREVVETIFDLNGRRLSQPQKGINIINGRKVVVK